MGLLISKADFTGRWDLAKSNKDNIDNYIAEYEERYLIDLLGYDLFQLFKADVDNITHKPVTTIYLNIYNALQVKRDVYLYNSFGMKEVLLGLVYFDYVRDKQVDNTMNGIAKIQTEVSTSSEGTFLYRRYNDAIDSYMTIQWYIVYNKTDYPTFMGVYKPKSSFI